MAEKKETRYENIKKASELLNKDGKIEELLKVSEISQKSVKNLKSALEEKLKALEKARKEKAQQVVEQPVVEEPVKAVKEEKVKVEEKPVEKVEEVKPEPEKEQTVVEVVKEEPIKEQPKEEKKAEQPVKRNEFVAPERPSFIVRHENPEKKVERPSFIVRHESPEKRERVNNDRRPRTEKPQGKEAFNKGAKPEFNRQGERQGAMKKPAQSTYIAPPVLPTANDKRNFTKKKQGGDKQYEEKKVINKRALIKNQVDIDDFDENKSGYRKFRPVKKEKKASEVNVIKIEKAVITTEMIPLKVLSEKIVITAA